MFKTIKDLKIKKITMNNLFLNYNKFIKRIECSCNLNEKKCFICNDSFYDSKYLFYTNEIIEGSKYFYEIIYYKNNDVDYNLYDIMVDCENVYVPAIFLAKYTLIKDKNNIIRKVFLFDEHKQYYNIELKNILSIFYAEDYYSISNIKCFFNNKFKNENLKLKVFDKLLNNNSYCFFQFENCFYDINKDFEDPDKFKIILKEAIFNLMGNKKNIDFFNKEQLPFNLDFYLLCK